MSQLPIILKLDFYPQSSHPLRILDCTVGPYYGWSYFPFFTLNSKLREMFYVANILCLLLAEKVKQKLYFNDIEKLKQYLSVHCIKTWPGSDTKMATKNLPSR